MNDTNHEANRRIQLNRHLKERTENFRLEQQSDYALKAKHKQEHEQLRYKETSPALTMELKRHQAHEFTNLRYQQSQSRMTLAKQQAQEVATFDR
jgi:hypothetical protein